MIATLPALWFNSIPPAMPAALWPMAAAMLVVLGLLCAAVAVLLYDSGRAPRSLRSPRHRRVRARRPVSRPTLRLAPERVAR